MRNAFGLLFALTITLAPVWSHAGEAPHGVAGFVLGEPIDAYTSKIRPESVLPIRYQPALKEVATKSIRGFKTGLITYGDCSPDKPIVRLKLKYADGSRSFYKQLLKRYKRKFGEDPEWRGDPFHVFLAWKWAFTDAKGNRISLVLQHNVLDQEEKKGTSVKMTMWNLIEAQQRCYDRKHPARETNGGRRKGKKDWRWLIPQ